MKINEEMQTFNEEIAVFVPSNRTVILYHIDDDLIRSLRELSAKDVGPHVLGMMELRKGTNFDEVDSVFAEKGWGPLIYISTLLVDGGYIAPTRTKGQVTPAAANIWHKMKPEFVNAMTLNPIHDDTVLNRAFKASKQLKAKFSNELKMAMDRHHNLMSELGEDKEAVLLDAANMRLDSAMSAIYENRILKHFLNPR